MDSNHHQPEEGNDANNPGQEQPGGTANPNGDGKRVGSNGTGDPHEEQPQANEPRKGLQPRLARLFGHERAPSWVVAVSTVVIMILTAVYAAFAHQQVVAVQEQSSEFHSEFVRGERPIVGLDVGTGSGDVQFDNARGVMSWKVSIENYGKSPALYEHNGENALYLGYDAAYNVEKFFSNPNLTSTVKSGALLVPGDTSTFFDLYSDPVAFADFKRYLGMDKMIYGVVHVDYADAEGNWYYTNLCFWRQSNGVVQYCDKHNEIGP